MRTALPLARVRARNVRVLQLDAAKPLPFAEAFDRILVDAPCSGTGTLARHPEIRWRLTIDALASLKPVQASLLHFAADSLKPGGRLVYSTCSIEREENEAVVSAALAGNPRLRRVAAEGAYAAIKKAGKTKDIVLTSIDGGRLGVQYVKEGKIAATVMQFPKKMAVRGVDYVIDFAKTGKKPSGFIDTGAELITDKPFSDLPSKDTKFGVENCWG